MGNQGWKRTVNYQEFQHDLVSYNNSTDGDWTGFNQSGAGKGNRSTSVDRVVLASVDDRSYAVVISNSGIESRALQLDPWAYGMDHDQHGDCTHCHQERQGKSPCRIHDWHDSGCCCRRIVCVGSRPIHQCPAGVRIAFSSQEVHKAVGNTF